MKKSEKSKAIVAKRGKAETELRDALRELQSEMGFDSEIEFDGETLSRERIEMWEGVLENIDKYCYYV